METIGDSDKVYIDNEDLAKLMPDKYIKAIERESDIVISHSEEIDLENSKEQEKLAMFKDISQFVLGVATGSARMLNNECIINKAFELDHILNEKRWGNI